MREKNFRYREDRDKEFDELEARGVRVEAWLIKNRDFEYKECCSGRYLVGKNIYQLRIFEEDKEDKKNENRRQNI